MKHFEEVWVKSEKVSQEYMDRFNNNESTAISDIMSRLHLLRELPDEEKKEQVGHILFLITYLSKIWNINVWTLLEETMNNYHVSVLDPDLESDI